MRLIDAVTLRDPGFWAGIAPGLHVDGGGFEPGEIGPPAPVLSSLPGEVLSVGYVACDAVVPPAEVRALLSGVIAVRSAGLPPLFVWAFDEPWSLFARLAPMWRAILGDEWRFVPAMWAWWVEHPDAGWPPHRDRAGQDVLRPDGAPSFFAVWVPLTPAVPRNGCMYVLPRGIDADHLVSVDLHEVRCLAAPAGSVMGWDGLVWHWGGKAAANAPCPRVSLSIELQRGDVPPFAGFVIDPRRPPDLEGRLRLIAAQVLHYTHMVPPSPELVALSRELLAG